MTDSILGASPSLATYVVVHQHHHFGWTMNTHTALSAEEAMRKDVLRYHPWLPQYGHRLSFSEGRYRVEYDGEPYPRAYFHTPAWAKMGDYWFGGRLHIGQADDCEKCGGTGVNHYNPFFECWKCGDGKTKGKSSGKARAAG